MLQVILLSSLNIKEITKKNHLIQKNHLIKNVLNISLLLIFNI